MLDALSLPRAHIVCSSLGASTIVRFSQSHQNRLDRFVLMAPGGFGCECNLSLRVPTLPVVGYALGRPTWLSNAYALRLSMADPRFATRELIDLAARLTERPGSHQAFVRTVTAGLGPFRVKGTNNFAKTAKALHRPALVLWGKQNTVFSVAPPDTAATLLPDTLLCHIDKCGHYPQWEAPEVFLREVLTFLA